MVSSPAKKSSAGLLTGTKRFGGSRRARDFAFDDVLGNRRAGFAEWSARSKSKFSSAAAGVPSASKWPRSKLSSDRCGFFGVRHRRHAFVHVVGEAVVAVEQRIVRDEVLAHRPDFLPFRLGRVGDVRIHRFGGGFEFRGVAFGVVQAQELERQIRIARMLRERVEQFGFRFGRQFRVLMRFFDEHVAVGFVEDHRLRTTHEAHQREQTDDQQRTARDRERQRVLIPRFFRRDRRDRGGGLRLQRCGCRRRR